MGYIALYRKYRPITFSDVFGQDVIVEILMNSIINNKIGHAYLFAGSRGTGKTSVAKIFARAVNCESNNNGDACNKCSTCIKLNENDIDIIEIDAASNNGVDEIREIRNNVKLTPTVGKYKVYIIDEVHMLSTGAFNALLKTLEEPPAHVIFILATTEVYKLPLTILSRCQRFDFKKIPNDILLKRLEYIVNKEKKDVNVNNLKLITELGDGSFRDSINLLDQIIDIKEADEEFLYKLSGSISLKEINQFLKLIISNNIKLVLDKINEFNNNGRNFTLISEKLLLLLRDISINNTVHDYFDDKYSELLEEYSNINLKEITEVSRRILEMLTDLKKSNNQKITFEINIINIINMFSEKSEENKIKTEKKEEKDVEIISREIILEECKLDVNNSDINSVRINNTLATANKSLLSTITKKMSDLEKYISSKKFNNIVRILMESKIVCCGDCNLILSVNSSASVNVLNKNIIKVETLLNDMFESVYKVAIVDENKWEEIKKEFIKNKKNNIKYEIIPEKDVIINNEKSNTENEAIALFGEESITVK